MSLQDTLNKLRGANVHVVGFAGTEGAAVVDFLVARGVTTITAHEIHGPDEFAGAFERTHQWLPAAERAAAGKRLLSYAIEYRWGERYLEGIEQAGVVFVPQSWFRYSENARLQELRRRGIAFSSMTRLFFEVCPCAIIGVTGTNGKFTVAHLVYQMLARSGRRAFFSGNDRTHVPMLYYLDDISPGDWLVLEISNRQLVDLPYSPNIAVITNILPHHLDDHGTMEAYVETKRAILAHQTGGDLAVLNADNASTARMAADCPNPFLFSRTRHVAQGAHVDGGSIVITRDRMEQRLPLSALRLPGAHTVENALAACLTASLAGASVPAMADVLSEFRGLQYRFHLVAEAGGVCFYEDSLATNPSAAAAAIASMDRPFVLIAGGARPRAAPEDFAPMRDALAGAPVKAVLLIGTTAPLLQEALQGLGVPVIAVGTLDRAVAEAAAQTAAGEAVLLSPGCESFDQFTDYRQRGDRFTQLVEALTART